LHNDTSSASPSQSISFPEQIKKLTDGLDLISSELKQKIRHDYPNLIKHSANASKLMVALESLDTDLMQLHTSVNNLKKNVYVPYDKLEKQIVVCERLYNASQLMRKIQKFLQLYRALKETSELNKQALLVYELDGLVQDKDLMKINMLIDEHAAVINLKQKLLHIANRDLLNGIQEMNETAIMKSLEIYRNLDVLGSLLDNQIESYLNDVRQSIKQCFNGADIQTLQKTSIKGSPTIVGTSTKSSKLPGRVPQLTTSMNFKSKLLAALEWLFTDELVTICDQVGALDGCLRKITSGYITEHPGKDFLRNFSRKLCDLLKTSFEESQVHVLQNLQQSLPKLLAFFNSFHSKVSSKELELDKSIFGSLKSGYIEKCAANLKIPAHEILSDDVVDSMVKNATTELTVSLIDDDLLNSVISVLCACNNDLISKIKSNVKLGSDAEQVVKMPNATQMQNINAANLVYHHQLKMQEMIVGLDIEKRDRGSYERLKRNVEDGRKVTMSILQQLLSQIMSNVNSILLTMHQEPSLNSDNLNVTSASLYMRELQEVLSRSWTSHMSPFNDKTAVMKIATELAMRTIELFIQNLCIIRPVSIKGRQRLRSDCTHLENLIQTILSDMSVLGNSYRMLRMISSFVLEQPEKLVDVENNLIPSYVILFMLFGHAADDLKSPHKAAGWTDEKLIAWLAEHKERERLELISGALLKYRNYIREKNKTQYDPVYPLISKLLEKAMAPYQKAPVRGLL
jgi:conserved oligomeric Golgi complex subunit 5